MEMSDVLLCIFLAVSLYWDIYTFRWLLRIERYQDVLCQLINAAYYQLGVTAARLDEMVGEGADGKGQD